jgi:DNA-binding response OmpR family regulator
LVVDDDHAIRKLLERIARRAGFEVHGAKDGVEALEMLDAQQFDVALIDLMMPRLSGYELVQEISVREQRPVIIVATAMTNTDVGTVDDSLVRRVIRKPFDVDAVAAALKEAAAGLGIVAAADSAEEPRADDAEPPVDDAGMPPPAGVC